MRVLFYSSYHATPHIETEMEVAKQLMSEGHEVFFLRCLRQLNICFANPDHTFLGCKVCISKISRGYEKIGVPEKNVFSFPETEVNIDEVYDEKKITNIDELKKLTYKGWDLGLAIFSSLVSSVRDHQPDVNYYKNFIKRGIKTAVFVYKSGSKLLDEIQPDIVYLFNGRFLEVRPFMRLCESKGIKFYTHERGGVLKNYLLREKGSPHSLKLAAEEIKNLWGNGGKEKEDTGRNFFEDRRKRVIQGWHSFTADQVYNKLPENFDVSKQNITMFNSSMDEFEGIAEFKNYIYKDDNDAIEKIVAAYQHDPSKHFNLRVHPNLKNLDNTQTKQIDALSKKYANLTVIGATEDIDTYELMDKSDKIIVFGSTTGIEAVYWNKPVILTSTAFYESLNCLYKPSTHEEVLQLLNDPELKPFNQKEALKYGYWILNMGTPFEHYQPLSVQKGLFENERLTPHLFWRALYIIENKLKNAKT
jgi:hypothetical protein